MNQYSRRRFIQTSITGIAGLSVLPLLKSCKTPVSDTIRLGFIGLGRQSVYLVNGFNSIPGVKVVAGCDVYGIKCERFEQIVRDFQEESGQVVEITTYHHYQDMLERKDIDAVVVASPDHWHALQVLDACRAGMHIYLEKPTTFTIEEGKRVVEAVRKNNLICAVGSQQRSDNNFRHAVKLVSEGKFPGLKKINAWVGGPPVAYDLPEESVPAGLDWDTWLGPNPYVHYNHQLNPPISLNPRVDETFWGGWRWYKEVGGGFLCDWGAHNFDIGQWALGMDNSGPVKIIPAGVEEREYITFIYENGIEMINAPFDERGDFGVKFWGDDAWIVVKRGFYEASDDSLLPPAEEAQRDVPYETGTPHLENFIRSIKTNTDPIANIEAGHRTASLGILGNIATDFHRALHWDPVKQNFVDDTEAAKCLHRVYREGYSL